MLTGERRIFRSPFFFLLTAPAVIRYHALVKGDHMANEPEAPRKWVGRLPFSIRIPVPKIDLLNRLGVGPAQDKLNETVNAALDDWIAKVEKGRTK